MPNMTDDVARRILDAVCIAIDHKPASAKTFSDEPFSDLTTYASWGQDANDSTKRVTTRTRAMLIAYLMFSGGRIPYSGIEVGGKWFRPDKWIAGALVKNGHALADDSEQVFVVTPHGWSLVAETLEMLSSGIGTTST